MATELINLAQWSAGPSNEERFEYYMNIGDQRTKLGHISMDVKTSIKEGKQTFTSVYNVCVHSVTKTGRISRSTRVIQLGLLDLDECKKLMQNHFKELILYTKHQYDLQMKKLSENEER